MDLLTHAHLSNVSTHLGAILAGLPPSMNPKSPVCTTATAPVSSTYWFNFLKSPLISARQRILPDPVRMVDAVAGSVETIVVVKDDSLRLCWVTTWWGMYEIGWDQRWVDRDLVEFSGKPSKREIVQQPQSYEENTNHNSTWLWNWISPLHCCCCCCRRWLWWNGKREICSVRKWKSRNVLRFYFDTCKWTIGLGDML